MSKENLILEITELGNPILREETKRIEDPFAPELQQLIDAMFETVIAARGVGLAAPQIGANLSLFVMTPNVEHRPPHDSLEDGIAVINPEFKPIGTASESDWEGCLSIPGIRGYVPRFTRIQATFTNRHGETVTTELEDFDARIFQHEYDHVKGKVFLDHIKPKDIITDKEYLRMVGALEEDDK